MNKINFSKAINSVKMSTSKHSPEILLGFGIAGFVSTVILAVKATPKAMAIIAEAKDEIKEEADEDIETIELRPVEIVKKTWKCYLPASVSFIFSLSCLIGSHSIDARRNAALATAYKLSEKAFNEYRSKVVETIGEAKEKKIRDAVKKDRVNSNKPKETNVIITGRGNTLCLDEMSGRYFESDIEVLRRIENELNKKMLSEMYISLNDLYCEIGLAPTPLGNDFGWNIDNGYIDMDFSSIIAPDDSIYAGKPCLVLGYRCAPRRDYSKLL